MASARTPTLGPTPVMLCGLAPAMPADTDRSALRAARSWMDWDWPHAFQRREIGVECRA